MVHLLTRRSGTLFYSENQRTMKSCMPCLRKSWVGRLSTSISERARRDWRWLTLCLPLQEVQRKHVWIVSLLRTIMACMDRRSMSVLKMESIDENECRLAGFVIMSCALLNFFDTEFCLFEEGRSWDLDDLWNLHVAKKKWALPHFSKEASVVPFVFALQRESLDSMKMRWNSKPSSNETKEKGRAGTDTRETECQPRLTFWLRPEQKQTRSSLHHPSVYLVYFDFVRTPLSFYAPTP